MEEEIIRRRLLTQTAVGHRGDPPLTKLTKHYLQFCNAAVSALKGGGGESQAKLEEMAEEAFRGVANIELLGQKQEAICAAHRADGAAFVEKRAALEAEVEAARRDIEARKAELVEARELRQHSEEYEKLRQAAMAFPKCSDMAAEIAMEEAALTSARSAAGSAARTVELRKKQFALLLQTISSLTDDMEGPPEDAAVNVAPDGAAAMETDN